MVRIALLAGSLEPGRDGVGDFTHGLAVEAAGTNSQIMMAALSDRNVSRVTREERDGVPAIRLPSVMDWQARLSYLSTSLNEFDPHWLSLQFVPYSFHRRGWIHGLARRLKPLLSKPSVPPKGSQTRLLHVMFHELWLGTYSAASWIHRLEGLWQRHGILAFVRAMQPAVVHTTNPAYARSLNKHRINAQILPLFGNIPVELESVNRSEAESWCTSQFSTMGLPADQRHRWWIFGVFGSIHPEWWPGQLFDAILALPESKRRRLALVIVGRTGPNGARITERLKEVYADRLVVRDLGEQSTARVASVFRHLDFGLATTPWELIEKSGSAAAMRDHGVPVIVTRTSECGADRLVASATEDQLLLRFDSTLPAQLTNIHRRPARCRRSIITNRWLENLQSADDFPIDRTPSMTTE